MNHRSVNKILAKRVSVRSRPPVAEVLQAALDLFSSKGYEETKMAEIADRAGLSVGALYLRFKGKEELFLELIKDQTKDHDELTKRFSQSGKDPLSLLKEYIEFSLEYACGKKQMLSMVMREHRLPFMQPLRKKFFDTQHKMIRGLLAAGVKQGCFRRMNLDDTALMIFASIRGSVLMKIVFGTGEIKTMSDTLFDLITEGIGRHANKE